MLARNLGQMVDRMSKALLGTPNTISDKEDKKRRLNEAMLELSDNSNYRFLQREVTLAFRPRVTSTTIGLTIGSSNLRLVTASDDLFEESMEGQEFTIDGTEYRIVGVASATTAYINRSAAAAIVTPTTDWTIRYDRHPLPKRTTDIIDFYEPETSSGRGRNLRWASLAAQARFPRNFALPGQVDMLCQRQMILDRPPETPPTLTDQNVIGGEYGDGNEYEVVYTFVLEGRESPPSPAARIKMSTAADRAIRVSNVEDMRWDIASASPKAAGVKVRIYLRNVTQHGRMVRMAEQSDVDIASNYDIDTKFPGGSSGVVIESLRELPELDEYAGGREHVSVYHEASELTLVTMLCKVRPRVMVQDADVPEFWPEHYIDMIWKLALVGLLTDLNAMAQADRYQKKVDARLVDLNNRYLDVRKNEARIGGWSHASVAGKTVGRNYGTPVKT